jgi:uncharacterized protein (DUF433 family)
VRSGPVTDDRPAPIYARDNVTPCPYGRLVMTTTRGSSLHRGIYDVVEVARLIGVGTDAVNRWTTPTKDGKPPIVAPSLGWAFTFYDLVSLKVVAQLRQRKVKPDEIRAGIEWLSQELDTDRPLAHEQFATVGVSWFANVARNASAPPDWVDAGKSGQQAFEEIVLPAIRPLDYDKSMASRWRPSERVTIDPEVQAGAPCITGTRIPTSAIADLVQRAGDDPVDIAADLEIDLDDVLAALRFEEHPAAA